MTGHVSENKTRVHNHYVTGLTPHRFSIFSTTYKYNAPVAFVTPKMITYHIYDDSFWGWRWTVKDPDKKNIHYTIRRERHLCSSNKYHIYRGPSDSSPCIATIERSEWNRRWHIHFHQTGEKINIHSPHFFSANWSFHHAGHEYHWTRNNNLRDSNDNLIAMLEPRRFSWHKVGTLSVKKHQVGNLDVIMGTAVIVQRS